MKYSLLFVLSICFNLLHAQPQANRNESAKILPYPIHQKKLPNGLNVVTVPYDSPGLAAFYIVVRVGSREEVEEGKTGFAHFFEHMMFRGTEKYPKEKYSDELKATGASANANTWLDRTVYHMTGNAEKLEKMFELESDRFMNLSYSIQDFKTEAGAVKGEYTKNFASPYMQLNEKMNDVAFTTHTYKHTTMGFFNDIVDMPNQYDFSRIFFNRFYRPEYTTILVVGDVTPERVNSLSEKYFGSWQQGTYTPEIPKEPQQKETRYAHVKKANFPPQIGLNFKGPAFTDNDKSIIALDLLVSMLFSEKSEIYKKLVIGEQKARSLNASYLFTRDPYLIQFSASITDAKNLQYIKDEIMASLNKAKTTAYNETEILEAKSRLKYSFAMGLDSPTSIAEKLSFYIWVTGNPESLNRTYALYDEVTAADMMEAARKYFNAESLTITTISPEEVSTVR